VTSGPPSARVLDSARGVVLGSRPGKTGRQVTRRTERGSGGLLGKRDCAMLPSTRIKPARRPRRLPKHLLLVAVLCCPASVGGQELGPPLPSWFPITSTFCEYRTQHFHAGIDLATGGRVGVPVLAVGRGHVHRVRVSGAGYGKAVYLCLDNGLTAVYGHLDGFRKRSSRSGLGSRVRDYEQDPFRRPACWAWSRRDRVFRRH
jgi:hypothetical protein